MSGNRIVTTVLGDIPSDTLGITLAHEHCLINMLDQFQYPPEPSRRRIADQKVSMEILADLRRRPFSTRDNLVLDDEELIIKELGRYQRYGGTSLVDATSIGLGRDPLGLQRLSRATGLNIIMGTGIYTEPAHPAWVAERSIDELAEIMVGDITVGAENTDVRCGVIGEVGLGGIAKGGARNVKAAPLTADEEKALRGAARASLATGVCISVHLDSVQPLAGLPALAILAEEGVAPDRVIIGHLDQIHDLDYHKAIADHGVFIGYDTLGTDHYRDEFGYGHEAGHDSWRTRFAMDLIRGGYRDQLLFSQDVCMKSKLRAFGGFGYAHVLENVVPTLRAFGATRDDIDTILIANPERAFGYGAGPTATDAEGEER